MVEGFARGHRARVAYAALALLTSVVLAWSACRRSHTGGGSCVTGELRCACNTFGVCREGLCESGVCVSVRCEVGAAGCGCFTDGRCSDRLSCRRGICFDRDDPLTRNYYYSEKSSTDVERVHALILERLMLVPGMRVADVGAGRGLMTIPIAEQVGPAGTVYATDVDRAALSLLQRAASVVPAARRAPVVTRPLARPFDTGLDDVAAGSLDRMLMINVFGFGAGTPRQEVVAQLRRFARLLRPGGTLVYHQDWLYPDREFERPALVALFAEAGLHLTGDVPMPSHIPAQTQFFDLGFSAPPVVLRRGYILLFGP